MTAKTSIIVAMAENRCIGLDNKMPWHIRDDLKRFKEITMGHPVIMGRKTYESILGYLGKPLPGRTNIVVSRNGFKNLHEVPVFSDLEAAIKYGHELAKDEVFIIGGAQIYGQALPLSNIIHLTQVHKYFEGDAYFPEIDQKNWAEIAREDHDNHTPPYSFVTLKKVKH
jgi:dihydrofolate reductase